MVHTVSATGAENGIKARPLTLPSTRRARTQGFVASNARAVDPVAPRQANGIPRNTCFGACSICSTTDLYIGFVFKVVSDVSLQIE